MEFSCGLDSVRGGDSSVEVFCVWESCGGVEGIVVAWLVVFEDCGSGTF